MGFEAEGCIIDRQLAQTRLEEIGSKANGADFVEANFEGFEFFDPVREVKDAGGLIAGTLLLGSGFQVAEFGFVALAEDADILAAELGQEVGIEFVVVEQAGECGV
ncbi:hypothetical protein C7B65_26645 [Phormidesmis priestleyi ULC007]|uniref:Uncharacterized protein n=1 Tax=Phormidesmis priestleyi ULC007 TaxID=1920490 RepID=A0A2T1D1A9_9CYAN|nr:hypothetical protein [Phormidesmis priestleyi]PSB14277.1 hypothetical protein C7B65_26645 [Phormidesmis priestleyi ULC007]